MKGRDGFFKPASTALVTGVVSMVATTIMSLIPAVASSQTTLRLAIQPIQSEQRTREIFLPLAEYIEDVTGSSVEIVTYPNFLSFWSETQKPDTYDMVFDAAHFIDYRNKNHDFTVLAKQTGTVSYSLIVPEDSLVFDPQELIGKKIATLGPPSLGAVRIEQIFENPLRQPLVIETDNSEQAMQMVLEGKVDAAMLPTPLVSAQMSGEGGVNVVMTTEPVPSMAFSVSPRVNAENREKLDKAMKETDKTEAGKKMLEQTRLNPFEDTNNAAYFGYSELLGEN
jgi:phosphonate transport system substrate-binding protein